MRVRRCQVRQGSGLSLNVGIRQHRDGIMKFHVRLHYHRGMFFWRRHSFRLVSAAIALLMMVALAPTLSRLLAAADPVRAAMLAEICSATMPASSRADAGALGMTDAAGGSHCPACLSPALGALLPEPDRRADYRLIEPRPAPVLRIDFVPDAAAHHPPLPARAPPALA